MTPRRQRDGHHREPGATSTTSAARLPSSRFARYLPDPPARCSRANRTRRRTALSRSQTGSRASTRTACSGGRRPDRRSQPAGQRLHGATRSSATAPPSTRRSRCSTPSRSSHSPVCRAPPARRQPARRRNGEQSIGQISRTDEVHARLRQSLSRRAPSRGRYRFSASEVSCEITAQLSPFRCVRFSDRRRSKGLAALQFGVVRQGICPTEKEWYAQA